MIDTTEQTLPLRTGTTVGHDLLIEVDDDSLALDTVTEARIHIRRAQRRESELSLSTTGGASARGSTLTVHEATRDRLVLRLHLTPADTSALPWAGVLGSDVEIEWPSGDVARPWRITWTPDGEWTHG